MITYQVEKFADVPRSETDGLFRIHWEEIALDKDSIPLDIDYDRYLSLEQEGHLHVVTARDNGRLIGYYSAIIGPHLHYKGTKMAHTDVYFVIPEYRLTRVGMSLFIFAEKTLRDRGDIVKMLSSTKIHQDHGRLFEALKWNEVERLYTKVL